MARLECAFCVLRSWGFSAVFGMLGVWLITQLGAVTMGGRVVDDIIDISSLEEDLGLANACGWL